MTRIAASQEDRPARLKHRRRPFLDLQQLYRPITRKFLLLILALATSLMSHSQLEPSLRDVSGMVVNDHNEVVPDVKVIVEFASGTIETQTDANGTFRMHVPREALKLRVLGKYIVNGDLAIGASDPSDNLWLQIRYSIPTVHEQLVITA